MMHQSRRELIVRQKIVIYFSAPLERSFFRKLEIMLEVLSPLSIKIVNSTIQSRMHTLQHLNVRNTMYVDKVAEKHLKVTLGQKMSVSGGAFESVRRGIVWPFGSGRCHSPPSLLRPSSVPPPSLLRPPPTIKIQIGHKRCKGEARPLLGPGIQPDVKM